MTHTEIKTKGVLQARENGAEVYIVIGTWNKAVKINCLLETSFIFILLSQDGFVLQENILSFKQQHKRNSNTFANKQQKKKNIPKPQVKFTKKVNDNLSWHAAVAYEVVNLEASDDETTSVTKSWNDNEMEITLGFKVK